MLWDLDALQFQLEMLDPATRALIVVIVVFILLRAVDYAVLGLKVRLYERVAGSLASLLRSLFR